MKYLIEPLSLDEAYLDVSDCEHCEGSATLVANDIRRRIREELGVTASAGVAPNKFLAKVASDWNKPDGTFTIAPHQVAGFVFNLPVSKINGVGKVTAEKLKNIGVETCGDLQQVPVEKLAMRFGKYGPRLAELAHGIDNRSVKTSRVRKSMSVERTYVEDIDTEQGVIDAIPELLEELARRFAKIDTQYVPSKRYVKVKFNTFSQTTLEEIIAGDTQAWLSLADFQRLLTTAWRREQRPVRLLGAGLRLQPANRPDMLQFELFDDL